MMLKILHLGLKKEKKILNCLFSLKFKHHRFMKKHKYKKMFHKTLKIPILLNRDKSAYFEKVKICVLT